MPGAGLVLGVSAGASGTGAVWMAEGAVAGSVAYLVQGPRGSMRRHDDLDAALDRLWRPWLGAAENSTRRGR